MMNSDPHRSERVLRAGMPVEEAEGAILLLHGRGGTAEDMLSLGKTVGGPRFALLSPQAADNSWYPYSFLSPLERNEPWLTSALRKVEDVLGQAQNAGLPATRIFLCGFSQGACLATEFVARNPRRYGGLVAFTGGLIGPIDADMTHTGDLAQTPVFLGSGDPDPHVPWQRVEQSRDILEAMGALVTLRRYPGRSHSISPEEIELGQRLVEDSRLAR